MPVISGKRAFLELLRQEGVEILFGNPGTTELPLMDAFAVETAPRYVLGLQEAAVMAMADGYAQASGKLTVVNVHTTPGLGNTLGMLYDAQKAGSPILVTAGQQDQSYALSEPILWADLPTIARPFVKWSEEVRSLADLPRAIHRAAKVALTPPTGPVFLSIPADILNAEADIDLGAPTRIAPGLRGDRAAIEAAAALMAKAERPVIVAGDAVAQSDAFPEIVALAEALGAPVYLETVASTASFPASHPLFAGTTGRLAPGIAEILGRHDLLFCVGGELFTLSLPSDTDPMPPGLTVVQLDTNPWEMGKNYAAAVAILGDAKATLPEIDAALRRHMTPERQARIAARATKTRGEIAAARRALADKARGLAARQPIQALALMQRIAETLPPDAVVVEETLSSVGGVRELFQSDDPQSFFGLRGGGIGWGLPAAIGVKLALPDRPVVALIGDGSSLYTCQAMWTAAHEHIGVVFVIINNGGYRILRQRVTAMRGFAEQTGKFVGMEIANPSIDFLALARSFGIEAARASRLDEVAALLRRGIASGESLLIDVEVDGTL